jgi:YspA, cpYpsA-related SLOG family
VLRPLSLTLGGAAPVRSPSGDRRKAAMDAASPTRSIIMATNHDDTDLEPVHASSSTDHVLAELQLYGHRPFQDEPDPRSLPAADAVGGAVADIFDALVATLGDTRLEPDLENLLWSTVNLFHRAADRVQRELDDNEDDQKRGQKEQDGSEVRSVELERLVAEGLTLIERRNAMELFRDLAADQFERYTGSSWRPRAGSLVNHRTLTAAMIDSRDFLAAKRRIETEVLLPAGVKIAFTGGINYNDHRAIWDRLDRVHAKHPDMVLLHGGSPKGAERIAACWADNRKVTQIAFKPDWARHGKAAPFKRNDQMLDVLPIGVIAFPGSGISANLADKARKMGVPVWQLGDGGA